jgi:flagellar biosynthesis/type III secretory pathway protein FliH
LKKERKITEVFMKLSNLKKFTMAGALGLVAILGTSEVANAQYSNDRFRDKQIRKQQERIQKQQQRINRQQQKIYQQQRSNQQSYNQQRYRVYRNGGYYNTDQRGAQLLQQAVNSGYQQGFRAGQSDASRRTRYGYNNQSAYRSGTYGYQSYVDRNQYQYYFQQGFQKGYEDGYYRRNQYGNSGTNILSSILSSILNIQQY